MRHGDSQLPDVGSRLRLLARWEVLASRDDGTPRELIDGIHGLTVGHLPPRLLRVVVDLELLLEVRLVVRRLLLLQGTQNDTEGQTACLSFDLSPPL